LGRASANPQNPTIETKTIAFCQDYSNKTLQILNILLHYGSSHFNPHNMFSPSYRFKLLATTVTLASTGFLPGAVALAESCPGGSVRPTAISQVSHQAKQQTVVDIAASAGSFNTLTAALKAAGLVEVLEGKGPFTVFAPTDKAFAALPQGTLENLLKPENKDKLVKILTYHVVSGTIMSTDLKAGEVVTVEGSPVTIQLGKSVTVDDARIVKADIKASNGVIHVIDKVIIPSN
jgi:uncharacterized surface protein with fasciclin (FAS1) repeats